MTKEKVSKINTLKFDDRGLIPAIVQDRSTGEVLMMAWMNAESIQITLDKKEAVFVESKKRSFYILYRNPAARVLD